jgi:hypothetical protein
VLQGVAQCFEKTDNGKLTERLLIEPISANQLECMSKGAANLDYECSACPFASSVPAKIINNKFSLYTIAVRSANVLRKDNCCWCRGQNLL